MEIENFGNSAFLEGFGLSGAAARTGEFKIIRRYKFYKKRGRGVYKNNISNQTGHKEKTNADSRSIR